MVNNSKRLLTSSKIMATLILTMYVGCLLVIVAGAIVRPGVLVSDEPVKGQNSTIVTPAEETTAHTETVEFETIEETTEETTEETVPVKELVTEPLLFNEVSYECFYDIELSKSYVEKLVSHVKLLEDAIASDDYTEDATLTMDAERIRINDIINKTNADINRWTVWEEEHYYAAKTYEFFLKNGYSAEVACGIIGNMMIETSGGTLNLKPTIYSSDRGFYGLCQWSLYYRPNVKDMAFEDQLVYLQNDIEEEFNTFGFCYKKNFNYEGFLALEDPSAAAIAFAKVYERPGAGTYTLRANCAEIAYEYFVTAAQ